MISFTPPEFGKLEYAIQLKARAHALAPVRARAKMRMHIQRHARTPEGRHLDRRR